MGFTNLIVNFMYRKTIFLRTASVILAFSVLFASCSSPTLIQTNPSGAKVYMNEEYKGVTPLSYSDTKIVGSTSSVRLELEGYESLNTVLSRNEAADVGAIIGGVFFLFPFLWTMKYNPVHTYELRSLNTASITQAEAPSMELVDADSEYVSCVLKD